MALYYNLSNVNEQAQNELVVVQNTIEEFVEMAETKLLKLEKAISKKKYDKVLKHVAKLKKYLILFDIDECVEYSNEIEIWANKQASRKEIDEVFKVYNIRIEKALKEMKKDFKMA